MSAHPPRSAAHARARGSVSGPYSRSARHTAPPNRLGRCGSSSSARSSSASVRRRAQLEDRRDGALAPPPGDLQQLGVALPGAPRGGDHRAARRQPRLPLPRQRPRHPRLPRRPRLDHRVVPRRYQQRQVRVVAPRGDQLVQTGGQCGIFEVDELGDRVEPLRALLGVPAQRRRRLPPAQPHQVREDAQRQIDPPLVGIGMVGRVEQMFGDRSDR
ncbi:hypothetical protein [Actinomadura madurae]|uniref:hypothetical protein n=1 Tax=Actinomadura madurae TaxID=1993 RepID=UPI0020D25658|nr:hypothetical protein [Actinomadura madurae]MCP9955008.1 hypothetical protein [Actinomadura madurae]MCP9971743.1 hypothetical protein [Actinomadura madurae]MCP9984243.1 hypothetical protein [Actinomadura madurae]